MRKIEIISSPRLRTYRSAASVERASIFPNIPPYRVKLALLNPNIIVKND